MRSEITIKRKLWDLRHRQADAKAVNDEDTERRMIHLIAALEWALGMDPHAENFVITKND